MFVIISIIIYGSKEFLKVILIFRSLLTKKISERVNGSIKTSPLFIIFLWKPKLMVDIILHTVINPIDYLMILILDGVMENLNLLLINYYFTLYFNQTGISPTDIISTISNILGIIIKIGQSLLLYRKNKLKVIPTSINQ